MHTHLSSSLLRLSLLQVGHKVRVYISIRSCQEAQVQLQSPSQEPHQHCTSTAVLATASQAGSMWCAV